MEHQHVSPLAYGQGVGPGLMVECHGEPGNDPSWGAQSAPVRGIIISALCSKIAQCKAYGPATELAF